MVISKGKVNILLTGSSGFLGQVIKQNLSDRNIITIGRSNSRIICDFSENIPLLSNNIDLVVHAAGKAHSLPKTKLEKQRFFDVNVKGTEHLLKGLERSSLISGFVYISSVAVYGRIAGSLINEDSPLNAQDPYGRSKIQAESIIKEWCEKNNVICTILRLPLLAGANPRGNFAAMINGIKNGYYFDVVGGKARKSVVLAEDIAKIIPVAAELGGIYNLTDGYNPSFFELSELIARQIGRSKPANIPHWLASIMAKAGDLIGSRAPINSDKLQKITSDLTFDDSKARENLGWNPTPVLEGFKIK